MSEYTSDGFVSDLGKKFVPGELGNYIGPHWSNGEFQESVEWGDKPPQSDLDLLAYYHDSAYAKYKDDDHREAADKLFAEEARKLGYSMADISAVLVQQGNMTKRSFDRTLRNVALGEKVGGAPGALLGLIYTGVENIFKANDRLPGGKFESVVKEVQDYYATDPHKRQNMFKQLTPEARAAVVETEDQRIARLKPFYDELTENQRKKNKEADDRMVAAAEKRRQQKAAAQFAPRKSRLPALEPEPEEEQTVQVAPSAEPLWVGALSHKPQVAPEPEKIAAQGQAEFIPVKGGFSRLAQLFKKKKKKKKHVVQVQPQELVEKQAEKFRKFNQLKQDAERSQLKPAHQNKFWFYGPGQEKIDRKLSEKRLAQTSSGGWRSK